MTDLGGRMEAHMPRNLDIQGPAQAENQNRKFYIRFLADRFREAAQEAQEMVDKAKKLISTISPLGGHGAQLVSFLEQARSQYGQIVCFYKANNAMLNYF